MLRGPSNEDALIRKVRQRFGQASAGSSRFLHLGIGDDAAIFIPSPGHETILTCDWFLEGTHFLRNKHSADSIGWKCLARTVSDIAAMGAVPRCFLLSLGLPATHTAHWLDDFLGGLLRASRRFACALAGGDTTRRSDILIHVTVIGEIVKGRAVLRSGARPGDLIYVSGTLGEAELGLKRIRSPHRADKGDPAVLKHLYPEPRLALGGWLAESALATAMMDLSDGLSSDLPRICSAGGVGARVKARSLPAVSISPREVSRGLAPLELALHGGDDYELLFTVPPRKAKLIPRSYEGVSLTAIGEVTRGRQLLLIDDRGRKSILKPGGWDPFRVPSKPSRRL